MKDTAEVEEGGSSTHLVPSDLLPSPPRPPHRHHRPAFLPPTSVRPVDTESHLPAPVHSRLKDSSSSQVETSKMNCVEGARGGSVWKYPAERARRHREDIFSLTEEEEKEDDE